MDYQIAANNLKDRVILVTGAGDGIGREAAIQYAAHGATVLLLGRTVAKLEAVYDQIERNGNKQAVIIPLDLMGATKQHYLEMASTIQQQFGRLDGVLHNAGLLGQLSPLKSTALTYPSNFTINQTITRWANYLYLINRWSQRTRILGNLCYF